MKEIVTQHNDLIELPLRNFNASELDILLVICYSVQNKGTNDIVLHLDDIKKLAHYQNKNKQQFIDALKSTNRKLMKLDFILGDDRHFVQFVLFPRFEVNLNEGTLTVRVAEEFTYLLNNFTGNYTRLDLQQSASLKSSYAKGIYKRLREFRDLGKWKVTIEEFRQFLDIPMSYRPSNINQQVIDPSIKELESFFPNLKCIPWYEEHRQKRGRPKLLGYIFTFKPQPHKEKPLITQESIAKRTGWQKTQFFCPRCHRPVFRKMLENENETYPLYGHTDFKTGDCDFTTFDSADLLRKEHLPAPELTEKQKENKAKLAGIIGGLFKK